MAVSNLSFAGLAAAGHSNLGMAAAIGFENFASGIGGVVVVAYLSALCDLRYTAAHFALLSAAASVVGRILSGLSAGQLIEQLGYPGFYILTTLAALPGIALFWLMMRSGLIDRLCRDRSSRRAFRPGRTLITHRLPLITGPIRHPLARPIRA
jgi:PAT family beta-lactamase induction signal transducer AmpG